MSDFGNPFSQGLLVRLAEAFPRTNVTAIAERVARAHWVKPLSSPDSYLLRAVEGAEAEGKYRLGDAAALAGSVGTRVAFGDRGHDEAGAFWRPILRAVERGSQPDEVAAAVRIGLAAGLPFLGPYAATYCERCEAADSWSEVPWW